MFKISHQKPVLILGVLVSILLVTAVIERTTLPETTDAMRYEAEHYGLRHGKETPPKPFVYDGCTFFVDSFITVDMQTACLTHDIAYWYGGTKEERQIADKKLREDVAELGVVGTVLSYPVYLGVRVFGDSWLTRAVNAHWGFGTE